MRKKDKRFKEFEIDILNNEYKVYVFIGDKEKAQKIICKYLKVNEELFEEQNRGKTIYLRDFHPCIWVDGALDYKSGVATLAHEAIHAVSHIMEYIGMDPRDTTGNEFLAHSVGAILRQCFK